MTARLPTVADIPFYQGVVSAYVCMGRALNDLRRTALPVADRLAVAAVTEEIEARVAGFRHTLAGLERKRMERAQRQVNRTAKVMAHGCAAVDVGGGTASVASHLAGDAFQPRPSAAPTLQNPLFTGDTS